MKTCKMFQIFKGGMDRLHGPIELSINAGVTHDRLHVFAGLGKRNRFYKFLRIAVLALRQPVIHPVRPGVIGGQCVFEGAEFIYHGPEVAGAKLHVDGRIKKLLAGEVPDLFLLGHAFANSR